jgi:hypothetical protein
MRYLYDSKSHNFAHHVFLCVLNHLEIVGAISGMILKTFASQQGDTVNILMVMHGPCVKQSYLPLTYTTS